VRQRGVHLGEHRQSGAQMEYGGNVAADGAPAVAPPPAWQQGKIRMPTLWANSKTLIAIFNQTAGPASKF
jgi:hypothetical protein